MSLLLLIIKTYCKYKNKIHSPRVHKLFKFIKNKHWNVNSKLSIQIVFRSHEPCFHVTYWYFCQLTILHFYFELNPMFSRKLPSPFPHMWGGGTSCIVMMSMTPFTKTLKFMTSVSRGSGYRAGLMYLYTKMYLILGNLFYSHKFIIDQESI